MNSGIGRINPNSQVALYAICNGNCSDQRSIQWKIYQGAFDDGLNSTRWIILSQMSAFDRIWFFGNGKFSD